MDVIILCGGKGTRLSEETIVKPKPMVEIGEIPILIHIMKMYSHYGYKRFVLALGYKGEYIKEYFYNYRIIRNDLQITFNGNNPIQCIESSDCKDWDITLIDTGQESFKNERIRRVEKYIKTDSFHLTYGDGVSDVNLHNLVDFHNRHKSIGTLTAVHPPARWGHLKLNGCDVEAFNEKTQIEKEYINGGFFVFDKKLFDYLDSQEEKDFEFSTLKKLAEKKQLKAYQHNGFWQCMDTVRERDYLNELAKTKKAKWIF